MSLTFASSFENETTVSPLVSEMTVESHAELRKDEYE